MYCRLVIDGNAVYEIDDECEQRKKEEEKRKKEQEERNGKRGRE